MKIISKFQDYYDCGVAYGVDEKIYFKRETTQGKPDKYQNWEDKRLATTLLDDGAVYFCGKRYKYKVRKISKTGKPQRTDAFNRETADYKYYYTIEQYLEDYPKKQKTRYKRYYANNYAIDEKYFEVKEVPDDEFIKRGVPYFTEYKNLPILKEYQFSKIVDPMVAFQEISMYLGNLNHKEPDCEIDEKFRKAGHGMDCTSFRKRGVKDQICTKGNK